MKTKSDLNALIPTITELLRDNKHNIGRSFCEPDEDGWSVCHEGEPNYLCYEDSGWCIEIFYDCFGDWDNAFGDLLSAWGEVSEISASHHDETTDEDSEFGTDDLKEFWSALDEALKNIA